MRRRPLSRSGRVGDLVSQSQRVRGCHVRLQSLTWSCCAGRRPRGLLRQTTFLDAGRRPTWSHELAWTRDYLYSGCATGCGARRHVGRAMVGSLQRGQMAHARVFIRHTCHCCCIPANSCSSRHSNKLDRDSGRKRLPGCEYSPRMTTSTKQQQSVNNREITVTVTQGSCTKEWRGVSAVQSRNLGRITNALARSRSRKYKTDDACLCVLGEGLSKGIMRGNAMPLKDATCRRRLSPSTTLTLLSPFMWGFAFSKKRPGARRYDAFKRSRNSR
jgi:hypothetical protein